MSPPDLDEDEGADERPDDARDRIILGNQNRDFTPAPIPVAPDGGPAPSAGYVDPIELPAPTEENCICVRGPCRFYMTWRNTMDVGNSKGVFADDRIPREGYRYCTAIVGDPIDMGPALVSECNRWDPEDESEPEFALRDRRRQIYLEHHPHLRPIAESDVDSVVDDVPDPSDAAVPAAVSTDPTNAHKTE